MANVKRSKADKKQLFVRVMCMALAVLMISSVVFAAILSQVF